MKFKMGDEIEYRNVKDGPGVLRKIRALVPNGIQSCARPMVMLEGVAGVVLESHCFLAPRRKEGMMADLRGCEVKMGNDWQEGFKFHCWGYGAELCGNGDPSAMWSIGIVEGPDGKILEVSPEYIRFTDRLAKREEEKDGRRKML